MNVCALILAAVAAAAPQGWSGFRNGGASSLEATGFPRNWSPTENIVWKVALPGYGQSTPVVWDQRVFLTAIPGRQRGDQIVLCLDSRTGKQVWSRRLPTAAKGDLHDMVSRAAPTPIVQNGALFVFFESGDLLRLSTKDGEIEWQRNLFQEYGEFKNGHGLGCSPAQTRDALILMIDHQGPSYLLSVDKKSGKTRWKTERRARSSWTSPLVTRQGGREVVVASSSGDVDGYDAGTGERLWSFEGLTGNHIPSPVADGERLYLGAAIPRGNREGAAGRTPAQSNLALRFTERDSRPGVELAWEGKRAVCEYGSPTLHRGLLYYVNAAGVAFCVDALTGEEKYSERVDAPCWVPPLGVGDHVYFFGRNGLTTVVKAGPQFEKVSTNRLWETTDPPLPTVDYTPPRRPAGAGEQRPADGGEGRGGRAATGPLDPCVFGVAAAEGKFFIRVGSHLFCVSDR